MTQAARRKSPISNAAAELAGLRSAFDKFLTPIALLDSEFRVIYANAKAADLGAELGGVLDGGSTERITSDKLKVATTARSDHSPLSEEGAFPSTRYLIKDGRYYVVTLSSYSAANSHSGYIAEWVDETEKVYAELELDLFQGVLEKASTAILLLDLDLNVTYANPAIEKLFADKETEIRFSYPSFNVDQLNQGQCIILNAFSDKQRALISNVDNLPLSTDLVVGELVFSLNVTAQLDSRGHHTGYTFEWCDTTAQRLEQLEVARMKAGVDGAEANLMMCDSDLRITYANPAVVAMFKYREEILRRHFPAFDVNKLVGQSIDQFHKNPSHQRHILSNIAALPAKAEIKLGDLEFEVNATAVLDADGCYMGNMVEWKDITEQKDAERKIADIISAAVDGRLDQRLNSDKYEGFMKRLSQAVNGLMDTIVAEQNFAEEQIKQLINSAIAGDLAKRIDNATSSGFLHRVSDGLNSLMDAIAKPVEESVRVMSSLAEGDLSEVMSGEYQGQFQAMQQAVNTSISNLRGMVDQIRDAATSIRNSSSEIAQGNLDLSNRTENQAASLEKTSASVVQFTATVKQNADNAAKANNLASSARSEAELGGKVVGEAVSAMREINASSKRIADIIGVIDEIAFQTNLLALNAAVEAARAGEQGRGFAVVASEVRNLAQRSAEAAKEIKVLIKDSVNKVSEGSKLIDESGTRLDGIMSSVNRVSDIIGEIAMSSQEQSLDIEQVSKAVRDMDRVTQENAALVEQAAAASQSMDDQSQVLTQRITFFKTESDKHARHRGTQLQRQARPVASGRTAERPAMRPGRENTAETRAPLSRPTAARSSAISVSSKGPRSEGVAERCSPPARSAASSQLVKPVSATRASSERLERAQPPKSTNFRNSAADSSRVAATSSSAVKLVSASAHEDDDWVEF